MQPYSCLACFQSCSDVSVMNDPFKWTDLYGERDRTGHHPEKTRSTVHGVQLQMRRERERRFIQRISQEKTDPTDRSVPPFHRSSFRIGHCSGLEAGSPSEKQDCVCVGVWNRNQGPTVTEQQSASDREKSCDWWLIDRDRLTACEWKGCYRSFFERDVLITSLITSLPYETADWLTDWLTDYCIKFAKKAVQFYTKEC